MKPCNLVATLISILCANGQQLNGFRGPTVGKSSIGNAIGYHRFETLAYCAQWCDIARSCRAFTWGFRGNAVWYMYDGNITGLVVRNGALHFTFIGLISSSSEVASGPTPDPSNAGLLGYIGPINGTWTSRIGDITPRGGRIVESAADCAALCSEKRACRSFDFGFRGLAHGTCHLSRLDRELAGRAFTVWPAFDYYERLLQNIPEY
eukprot:1744072-Amphidinium_carterae.1